MPTPGPTRPSAVGLLRGAHAELAAHGWHQGDLVDDDGRLCLLGALRHASGVHPLEEPADPRLLSCLREAQRALARPLTTSGQGTGSADPVAVLTRWNDDPARTAGDVLAHLAAVADTLDPPPTAAERPHHAGPGQVT